ncbi:sialate O-acetylesterase [Mariniphaga anaerophila]|uniref:Sialate O-acetylesterase n=1 Tax=Mariniphaga anaerophila TaxID=1484053 RepID=A0A1M4WK39_9BACT|nr:sialate O-acetylesterase [Mariniphaga anaerophila]SHE81352.1 sialate O-acetylesterase [Mariniphaga anaerophila]
MKRILFIIVVVLTNMTTLHANVILPSVIGDNMVLQRDAEVCLWGKSNRHTTIEVTTSWDNKVYKTTVDQAGNWTVKIKTIQAGGPYSICFDDGEKTVLSDVFLGDVWVCSGQSNMEMPLKGFTGQPVENSLNAIIESEQYPEIRMYTGIKTPALTPQDDVEGSWKQASIKESGKFSAVGYFYAKTLYQALHIPIGMIHVSWGGASIEAWMSKDILRMYPNIKLDNLNLDSPHPQQVPTLLYNGMLRPVSKYTIKGFIWYQGETNIPNYDQYTSLFPDMVKEWRVLFGDENLPFYYVQIAPFVYSGKDKEESAFLRESQLKCTTIIPNSGMAITLDKGEQSCIHPAEKEIVGQRLAYQALAKTYQFENFPCDGPNLESVNIEQNKMILAFKNAEIGLYPRLVELEGFQIAGKDGKYVTAKAVVNNFGNTIEVWSDDVKEPYYVRYGFKNFLKGSLFNAHGLPASSFRTDDFTREK